ncbi:uncharacterized protein BBOV_IV007780 [Babesia bovis T2Bo]|uniref:Uncharacterized protein n=1 Tax=Babesia bovis TaxID=5865 RepID=A7ARG3_BABBO|nr:uncharacterized protein BBOV_IV007780 [Babesia bovis T2Bo]EDO07132.1 hypothetical protein BBOV_IV007780 [Babesia bovis T2Bo]|eukprot:XP_001610700.1 hypothetical protein [Babesia bovis T2Bo]
MYLHLTYILLKLIQDADSFNYRNSVSISLYNARVPPQHFWHGKHFGDSIGIDTRRSTSRLYVIDGNDIHNLDKNENIEESSEGSSSPGDTSEPLPSSISQPQDDSTATNETNIDIQSFMSRFGDLGSTSPGDGERNIKISRKLWKVLMGLILYREKYGDFMVNPSFRFDDSDAPKLKGYCLGLELSSLMETTKLKDTDIKLYNKIMEYREGNPDEYTREDILQAPRLLWLIGFPTTTYLKEQADGDSDSIAVKGMGFRIPNPIKKRKPKFGDEDYEENQEEPEPIRDVKRIILGYFEDKYIHQRDILDHRKVQTLPEPSNRAKIRPGLLKGIVAKLLEMKQTKSSTVLTRSPTRDETEGGYHYAFYHWSFEDVVECMVLFNDMYMDYNRELLMESEKNGTPFNPVTYNTIKPEWYVPSDDLWPSKLHGFPLGLWLDKFRKGDIDAKEHWLRRDILDYLQFDWGDGMDYMSFTWDKLVKGLIWYINMKGHPIMDMPPHLVIPNTEIVAKWGKPEEIHGLRIGHLFYSALDQLPMIKRFYPKRLEFLDDMGIDYLDPDDIELGYRPVPHQRYTPTSPYIRFSKDGKYIKE